MSAHAPIAVAVVGVGKIAEDQHLPVIASDPRFKLVGLVSRAGVRRQGVPTFATQAELFRAVPETAAVANCTPPHVRHGLAREAIDAGKHVLLEKPPAATLSEMRDLRRHAASRGRVLFATWHSQFNAAVDEARKRLAGRKIRAFRIEWKEDVRHWHPGQDWVWDAGNFGVFDPGINALSILVKIMPGVVFVRKAELDVPEGRQTPIAARLEFASTAAVGPNAPMLAEFDWRQEGDQSWNIDVETDEGRNLRLTHGGTKLFIDGALALEAPAREYQGIYARFAELIGAGESDVDAAPLRLVADAFLLGSRRTVASFSW